MMIISGNKTGAAIRSRYLRVALTGLLLATSSIAASAPVAATVLWEQMPALDRASIASAPNPGGDVVHGFGNNIPLYMMLSEVVPSTWKTMIDPSVPADTQVSWRGGVEWQRILSDALAPAGLEPAYGDGDTLTIRPSKVAGAGLGSIFSRDPGAGESEYRLPGSRPSQSGVTTASAPGIPAATRHQEPYQPHQGNPAAAVFASAMPVESKAWTVRPGTTLKSVIQEWSGEAGWSVVWDTSRDWRIDAGATFTGSFDVVADQLLSAFRMASPPVQAEIYSNNVIVVRDVKR